MKKEVVMTQRDHAALLAVNVPLWETERELDFPSFARRPQELKHTSPD